jgi:hypothetical protein
MLKFIESDIGTRPKYTIRPFETSPYSTLLSNPPSLMYRPP